MWSGKDADIRKVQISEVVTEKLQHEPAEYYVTRLVKPVFACKCCQQSNIVKRNLVKATTPDSVLPVSVLAISFIANMLCQKFA